ncbi:hypothetical protein M514_05721 [Trichuris suis]|uniref:Uncharacterized protein n=1 Tax=Trichuris suis TaxID=68888 RepID=A0A085M8B1_9BILA|nr:hypothetical protein M513_05721 [Trichuris suis]KFD66488.1 hypothetical protein M514_05721 [Trichuris suis]
MVRHDNKFGARRTQSKLKVTGRVQLGKKPCEAFGPEQSSSSGTRKTEQLRQQKELHVNVRLPNF